MSRSCYKDLEQLKFDCEREKDRAIFVDNMRNYLARRNATIIWGNGFLLETEDKKIQDFWNKNSVKYRLNELFFWAEELASKYGKVTFALLPTDSGEWKIVIADPLFTSYTARSFYLEELAVVWVRPYQDMSAMFLKVKMWKDKYQVEYANEKRELIAWDATADLEPDDKLKAGTYYHRLGFVPVVELQNYPNKNLYYSFPTTLEHSDWYNAIAFEKLAYQAYKDFKKELKLNHSRVFIDNISQNNAQKIIKDAFDLDDLNSEENVLGDYVINVGTNSKVTVSPGVGDFSIYANTLNAILDFYCKFANSSRFSDGDSVQKTSQESKATRSAQIESISAKIAMREQRYTELLCKWFAANDVMDYEASEIPFTFKINGNIQKEETVFLDNIIKQINLGTMSMKEAISKLRNIPLTTAEKVFEQIKDFNEENELVTSLQGMELDDEMGEGGPNDNIGGDGRPKDLSEDLKD